MLWLCLVISAASIISGVSAVKTVPQVKTHAWGIVLSIASLLPLLTLVWVLRDDATNSDPASMGLWMLWLDLWFPFFLGLVGLAVVTLLYLLTTVVSIAMDPPPRRIPIRMTHALLVPAQVVLTLLVIVDYMPDV